MVTDDKATQIVLSLLKQYGVKKIIVSPGTTNVPISRYVQFDPFFEVYSIVDERSAAYVACGLSFASGEPVAISCTGATASRNYLPGLTEAFYRNLPVIAITSQHHSPLHLDFSPQVTDRTISQNDVKRFAALLPLVKDEEDCRICTQLVNIALQRTVIKGGGPVHINIPVAKMYSFKSKELPEYPKIDYYNSENFPASKLSKELSGKKIGVFIGSHKPFSKDTLNAISEFAVAYDAAVFYDNTSCYNGKNRVLTSVISGLLQSGNKPDIIIDIGSVSGDYTATPLFKDRPTWRISEDGLYMNRQNVQKLQKVFECSETMFFKTLAQYGSSSGYYQKLEKEVEKIKIPHMPFSNIYVASKLSSEIPKNSFLHLGILNSLRSMDFFELNKSVVSSSNVGGFGIDGAVSTTVGQALADKERLSFCVVGDLAFFYDMNILGARDFPKNVRIMLVNNSIGAEFRLNQTLEKLWGTDTNQLIAAAGHFGSAKLWAESMGLKYLTASTKEEFDKNLSTFCDSKHDSSVVFEVFTKVEDEQTALSNIRNINAPIVKTY
ncbi:MAG: hypothetical protein LBM93_14290 [Oscillospiraceae bacterium]|jgi:2-succinyl-5-enolpyruvyl-6-hydroxy-3-cyclohexene-1-carboxylate synthase|nr:hypothetical protein [Oscillospiraceae bacterium]